MSRDVLIRPLLTEKSNKLVEKQRKYTFIVDKKANKVEVKKAIEEMYAVTVAEVSTLIAPTKVKRRYTKKGIIQGRTVSVKKAIITLAEGDINFYDDDTQS
ncbi:MAG: 50S ribosomal protein L23 [Chitinophagales bacterium]|jgi:large subunit ribosomal protein L23|nr:50S ribosomal protein L23 [Chitinophagales bacterium]HNI44129.1 50S ribosomal protein L23 [Chitinophagales bacterium]